MNQSQDQYYVVKRDGRKEKVFFDKITSRISKLVDDNMKVDVIEIVKKTISSLYPGISTRELDTQSAYQAASMTSTHPDYSRLAGRIYVSSIHKETLGTFVEKMEYLQNHLGIYNEEWISFLQENRDTLNSRIDYDRDFEFDFFGIKTLERTYITKYKDKVVERPQDVFMRVASTIHIGDVDSTLKSYELMSQKYFTHASPTLFNSGNKKGNLVSCFLLGTEDSLEGINKTWHDVSQISKWGGGIGVHVSNIRAKGSQIRGTNGRSDGIIPMLQVYNSICRYINQSGKRKGSFAMYLEPHHPDIFEFLELRKNTGAESERARDLFLALWVSDLFMKQVKSDGDWYLLCPDRAPGLNDVYGDEYNRLYYKYVSEQKYNKKIKARVLWDAIQTAQFETGSPYILFKDHINFKSNQKNIGTIKSSNLCAEIVEYSDTKETAACNLASISLPNFAKSKRCVEDKSGLWKVYSLPDCKYCKWSKTLLQSHGMKFSEILVEKGSDVHQQLLESLQTVKTTFPVIFKDGMYLGGYTELYKYFGKKIDYDSLWSVAYHVTRNLDKVIDRNHYPTVESKRSNMRHRPIGLGTQGLADLLALIRVPYESKEALFVNQRVYSTIYHASLKASCDISKEREHDMRILCQYFKENPKPDTEFYDPNFSCDDKKINYFYHTLKPYSTELELETHNGSYSTFVGSPFSRGELQYYLWGVDPIEVKGQSWDDLIKDIQTYGVRNSLLTALMPTASTSQLLGNYESFEPFTSNIYSRRTLAGEFVVVNKHLVNDLMEIGEWNGETKNNIIKHNGSVQGLSNIPTVIKKSYLTSYEMKQKAIMDGCIARGPYIDQTQSMNLYFSEPNSRKLTSSQFYAWEKGLKTGLYYLRSKPSSNAAKVINDECISCSG